MAEHYRSISLTCLDLYIDEAAEWPGPRDTFTRNVIVDYQTVKPQYGKLTKVKSEDITLENYNSLFESNGITSPFESTLTFFDNLFYISEEITLHQNKKQKAIELIKLMNEHLPSTAYVPFSKNSYRLCNVLKIVTSQVKVFSTKQRAPLCICIETYCPAERLSKQLQDKFWVNVETPITLKMLNFNNRSSYFARNYERTAEFKKQRISSSKIRALGEVSNIMEEERLKEIRFNQFRIKNQPNELRELMALRHPYSVSLETELSARDPALLPSKEPRPLEQQLIQKKEANLPQKVLERISESNQSEGGYRELKSFNLNTKKYYDQAFNKMFGQPLEQAKKRISRNSVFGGITSWDVLWVIVKTHDDLKQEQFAMQLIHQFDYIFKLEKLPLLLTTYEVLSMGADRGIIEMVKDSTTFDNLQKTLQTSFPTKLSLREFFEIYFADLLVEAKDNFLKSLAAYCLVMYVLQAKDRHNGNILLHRTGKIFHIDFGFFLSNLPGKGIELQRDCPFKLLSEYVQVLDGIDSHYFKKFREYFFLGFKAVRKHQNKVLMLVKLMYSSSGMTMPCFVRGQAAITAMQARINPPTAHNDSLLNEHCQELINHSLDNWAAKWYDRFQYWAQGIFY